MNVYAWIFTGLLTVALVLYIVAQVRRLFTLEKVARCLFIPFILGLLASLLTNYLPDSYHILFIYTLAASSEALSLACTVGDKKKIFKFFMIFLFLLSCTIWTSLLFPVYKIYRIKEFILIIIEAVYFVGLVTICFFLKKQPVSKYAAAAVQYLICAFLSMTSLVSIIYEKRLFAVMMFTGSLCIMCRTIFQIFQSIRPFDITPRVEKIVITIQAVAASTFFGVGALLMQI